MNIYLLLLKSLVTLALFFSSLSAKGQTADQSENYYKEAVNNYKKGNYKKADSLYTLSLRSQQHPDTYFNRAMARLKLDNKTGYFEDLMAAGILGDIESKDLFKVQTLKTDTFRFTTTIVQLNMDSSTTNFSYVVYKLQNMPEQLELKYTTQNTLVNVSWFRETAADTSTMIENNASYRGGLSAMQKFIRLNLRYPKNAADKGISGKVFLKFTLNPNGRIERVVILKGIKECAECDAEALRLLLAMPRWNPAIVNGKPVKTYFTLPFSFKMQ